MKRHVHLVVGLFGLLELLCPRPVVAVLTRLAYRTPDSLEIREWVYTAARIEGAAFVLLALVGLYRSADRPAESDGGASTSGDASESTSKAAAESRACPICRIAGGSRGSERCPVCRAVDRAAGSTAVRSGK